MIYVRKKEKKIVSSEYQGSFIHYVAMLYFVYLFIYLFILYLPIYLSMHLIAYPFISLFQFSCLLIYLFAHFCLYLTRANVFFLLLLFFFCSPRRETGHPCWVWRHWVGQVWVKSKILQWDVESKIKTEDVSVEITLISELILSQIWMIYSSNTVRH